MKKKFIIMALPGFILLAIQTLPVQSRVIHADWEYNTIENLAGYRLYYNNTLACETRDPQAVSMECVLEAPDGEANFTLTAFFQDGSETLPSAPIVYIFSSSLKALFLPDVFGGESPLPVSFDASTSTGSITSYDWLFGDGDKGSGKIVDHVFTIAGDYTVNLKVKDAIGAIDQENASIAVTSPSTLNSPPKAAISSSLSVGKAPLLVHFDGSGSTDADGSIISYRWDTGDGGTASGAQVSYTYLSPGTFNATLTVTDNDGLTDSASTPVLVSKTTGVGKNKEPTAVISANKNKGTSPLLVSFDASDSTDSDGKITRYEWNFGDGTSATGVKAQHKYDQPATYSVSLRVTDDQGAISPSAKYTINVVKQGAEVSPMPDRATKALPFVINLLLRLPVVE